MTVLDKPSARAPRNPASPRILARCRVEFETFGSSFRSLEAKYKVPRSTLCYAANKDGWKKPNAVGVEQAAEVAIQILGAGLRRGPLGQKPVQSAPSKPEPPQHPADQPVQPASAAPDHAAPGSSDARTADVIDFPPSRPGASKLAGPVQLLPDRSPEEKAQLRITLGAIRAMMSVEQAQVLDAHLVRLLQYGHLIDVYLKPSEFVPEDPTLDLAARAARIVAVQDVARHMLLPTERDTLIGALKTLTTTLSETIGLQRTVVGIPQLFLADGIGRWNDPQRFHWTMSWQPSYRTEGRIDAAYILRTKPDAEIGPLVQDSQFRKDYVIDLRRASAFARRR
jgi:hypothetical protein